MITTTPCVASQMGNSVSPISSKHDADRKEEENKDEAKEIDEEWNWRPPSDAVDEENEVTENVVVLEAEEVIEEGEIPIPEQGEEVRRQRVKRRPNMPTKAYGRR